MSKTIKTPKPEDTTIHWLHKAVNADGTVANGTYNAGKNADKRRIKNPNTDFFERRSLYKAIRKAKRG